MSMCCCVLVLCEDFNNFLTGISDVDSAQAYATTCDADDVGHNTQCSFTCNAGFTMVGAGSATFICDPKTSPHPAWEHVNGSEVSVSCEEGTSYLLGPVVFSARTFEVSQSSCRVLF